MKHLGCKVRLCICKQSINKVWCRCPHLRSRALLPRSSVYMCGVHKLHGNELFSVHKPHSELTYGNVLVHTHTQNEINATKRKCDNLAFFFYSKSREFFHYIMFVVKCDSLTNILLLLQYCDAPF